MYILHITYDYMGNGIEGESFVCRSLRAATDKARERQLKFAKETEIATDKYVERWDDSIGYLYRKINDIEVDRIVAESNDSDRMYVKISEIHESDIVEEKITKEEILDRLANMELGLLGEFLTDNAMEMSFEFNSRFVYIYSPKEIVNVIEEGNDEGYYITIDKPVFHDEYLVVTKMDNLSHKIMMIRGISDKYEEFVSTLELDKVADHILSDNNLYGKFLEKCEEDDGLERWDK